jgi:hypothetical protein
MPTFIPRSVRGTPDEGEWTSFRVGVPDGLSTPLLGWVHPFFHCYNANFGEWQSDPAKLDAFSIDLGVDVDRAHPWQWVTSAMIDSPVQFIDVVDWCLHRTTDTEDAAALEDILSRGSSVWKVAWSGKVFELQDRMDSTAEMAARTSATPGSAATQHLAEAWSYVYNQSQNPTAGYRAAVLAVECVALPVVIPNDQSGTLGKAIHAMEAAPTKWMSSLGEYGVESAISMMRALWLQQRRHAMKDPSKPTAMTQPEAEAAVHLAAVLVYWFTSGAISSIS